MAIDFKNLNRWLFNLYVAEDAGMDYDSWSRLSRSEQCEVLDHAEEVRLLGKLNRIALLGNSRHLGSKAGLVRMASKRQA